jgi:hypothetical protein
MSILLRGIDDDLKFVEMMMERRHIFEHNGGVVDERYLRLSGDPAAKIGVIVRETRENAHRLIGILMRMAQNYHKDFHDIFTPTEWPVRHHREIEKRRKQRAASNQ